jgi:hypothetical protein
VVNMPCHPTPSATTCGMGDKGPKFCNGSGMCLDHCVDGELNADESNIDCGGLDCLKCDGDPCMLGDDCLNKNCVDGICCNLPCTETCFQCNLLNSKGTCAPTPQGIDDPGTCEGGESLTCDSLGKCIDYTPKVQLGASCTADAQCIRGKCLGPFGEEHCELAMNASCKLSEECGANKICDGTTLKCK